MTYVIRTRKVQIFRNFLQHHVLANVSLKRKKGFSTVVNEHSFS